MESFRLILLLAGIGLIAGIYLWGRHAERRGDGFERASEPPELTAPEFTAPEFTGVDFMDRHAEPEDELWLGGPLAARRDNGVEEEQLASLSLRSAAEEPDFDAFSASPASRDVPSPDEPPAEKLPPAPEDTVVVLTILAPAARPFSGDAIARAVDAAGLEFGDMDIYHCLAGNGQPPIFSLANGVEPGTFAPAAMGRLKTPALALFMRLPGPRNGADALQGMLDSGRAMAEGLGGELCDGRRQPLTDEGIRDLERRVRPYAPRPFAPEQPQ